MSFVVQGIFFYICGALRDLVPCAQFKKREKHPWRSVNFSKVAGYGALRDLVPFLQFKKRKNPPWRSVTFSKVAG